MNWPIRILIVVALLSFIALAFIVSASPPSRFDVDISRMAQEQINRGSLSFPVIVISVLGNGIMMPAAVLGAFAILYRRYRREAMFLFGVLAADGLNLVIKLVVHRARPTHAVIDVLQIFSQFSFPSGHVVHYVVFFGYLIGVLIHRRKFPLPVRALMILGLLFLIFTIPISRIYMGAHWMTDVVGGYLIGMIMLSALLSFYLKSP
jgi:membrane-associated phospholipid phosphatase